MLLSPPLCMLCVQNVYVATAIELKPNGVNFFPYVLYSHAILNSLHTKYSHEILEITAVYKSTSQPFFHIHVHKSIRLVHKHANTT